MNKLTDRQEKFCNEYLIDLNATQAAIRSGYSKKTAQEIGSQNLSKVLIQERLKELKEQLKKDTDVTAEIVINEFRKIALSSIAHLHNSWISLVDFQDLTDDQKATIESIQTRTRTIMEPGTDHPIVIEEVKIKLYDKQRALENLGKYLGLYEEDNKQKGIPVYFDEDDKKL